MKLYEGDFYLDEDGDFAVGREDGALANFRPNGFNELFNPEPDSFGHYFKTNSYLCPREFMT